MKFNSLLIVALFGVSFLQHGCGNAGNTTPQTVGNQNSVVASASPTRQLSTNSTSVPITPTPKIVNPSVNENAASDDEATNSIAERMNESRERCRHTPVDKIEAIPITGMSPLLVKFNGSKSYDPDGTKIIKWEWQFGDRKTALGENTSHVYEKPGTYTVNLVVTDTQGERSFDCGGGTFGATITVNKKLYIVNKKL